MAKKFLVAIDLNRNELQNAVIQNLGADPGTLSNGQLWYRSDINDLRARVNGATVSLLPTSLLGTANTWTAAQAFNAAITGNNTINLTGTGASSVGGTMGATAFVPAGLTGATSVSRYVGATASGSPSTGTFATGDYVVTQAGTIYVCTSGGSPGTWSRVGDYLLGATNAWTAANTFTGGVVVNTVGITGNKEINLTGTGASSVGGTLSATVHISTGITGATAASRYVGATASGGPSSGTFAVGDYVISQTGDVYVCTVAGSPGTWTRVGSYLLGATNSWSGANTFTGGLVVNTVGITGNQTINLTGTGASAVAGTFTGTAIIASGLSGATSASRYVGATASGAPSTGTFAIGDYVIARDGHMFICTTAGSPGTWVDVSASAATTLATSVTSETAYGQSASPGSASTASKGDHTHGTPTHGASDHSAIKISDLAAPTAAVAFNSQRITGLADPTNPQDAATKNYVDSVATGLDPKGSVRAAATTPLPTVTYANGTNGVGATLTASANGVLATVDGISLGAATSQAITAMTNATTTVTATVASTAQLAVGQAVTISGATGMTNVNGNWTIASIPNATTFTFVVATAPTGTYNASSATAITAADRVLVAGQASALQNGIYVVSDRGSATTPFILTRATDADTATELSAGAFTYVESGTSYAGAGMVMNTTGGITIGTTAISWTLFSGNTTYTAGAGLTQTGGVFAVGQGTGISVAADAVAVDTTVVARKYTTTVGNGAATTIVVNHALGNQWVNCQIFNASSPFDEEECDIQLTDANNVTLLFGTAPASGAIRVVITG